MLKIHRWFILVGIIFITFIFFSIDFSSSKVDSSFNKWVKEFSKILESKGVSSETITLFQKNAKLEPSVLPKEEKSEKLPELSLNQKIKSIVNENVILSSQLFFKENKAQLESLSKEYKSPISIVIAILGVGSHFGQDIGNLSLLNTLSTLAFTKQKDKSFDSELIDFLILVDRKYVSIDALGKKDGRFTYINIMPSVYLQYGVDANKDGIIDLVNSKVDILKTTANMLSKVNWEGENTWGNEIIIPNTLDLKTQQGVANSRELNDWKALGIVKANGEMLPRLSSKATLIIIDSPTSAVLLYDNFNSIYSLNNDLAKSLAIGILSERIAEYLSLVEYGKKVKPKPKPKVVAPKKKNNITEVPLQYRDIIK